MEENGEMETDRDGRGIRQKLSTKLWHCLIKMCKL